MHKPVQEMRMNMAKVVYWSQTGNTQTMAEAVAKGVTDAGKEAEIVFVSSASIDELKSETAFALGCPAMGAEVLEEGEMEPFVTELEGCVAGKTIGLFGSYGWGDGVDARLGRANDSSRSYSGRRRGCYLPGCTGR